MASDLHFQMYLLDGLARWNEDRAAAVRQTTGSSTPQLGYSALMKTALNTLGQKVVKHDIIGSVPAPMKYTGKLISKIFLLKPQQNDCMIDGLFSF